MKRVLGVVVFSILLLNAATGALSRLAPEDSAFAQTRTALEEENSPHTSFGSGHPPLTKRPLPVDLSYLNDVSIVPQARGASGAVEAAPPTEAEFDLRNYGMVSPVRDQNPWGSCWTFAVMGSAESSGLQQAWVKPDFSEKHLAWFGYTDIDSTYVAYDITLPQESIYEQGGNAFIAIGMLSRWNGIVSEQDAPYRDFDIPPSATAPNVAMVDSMIYGPGGASYADNMKYLIKNHGACDFQMYYEDGSYNGTTAAYYYSGEEESNHDVLVIGWDDNYSRENFATTPPGDGAWIVQNSWGTAWGNAGYFYVSYYDSCVRKEGTFFFKIDRAGKYDHVYFHDALGLTGQYSVGTDKTEQWFANMFEASRSHEIEAVGLYSMGIDATVSVFTYHGCSPGQPRSGTLTAPAQVVKLEMPGYYSIKLDHALRVSPGELFSIVISMKVDNVEQPIAVEKPQENYSSKATAEPNQSFVSGDGNSWTDLVTLKPNTNVCIKAFASKARSVQAPVNLLLFD